MTLAILSRYWQLLLGGVIAIALSLTLAVRTHQRDAARAGWAAEKTAFAATVASYRTATAQAQANDLTHARAVAARDAAITKESTDALQTQLADARAAADRYASRLQRASAADSGRSGVAGLPAATDPAGTAAGAGTTTVMDEDARVCARNTVIAAGWVDWWQQVAAAPR